MGGDRTYLTVVGPQEQHGGGLEVPQILPWGGLRYQDLLGGGVMGNRTYLTVVGPHNLPGVDVTAGQDLPEGGSAGGEAEGGGAGRGGAALLTTGTGRHPLPRRYKRVNKGAGWPPSLPWAPSSLAL